VALSVVAACVFGGGVWLTRGAEDGFAWFAAYLLEESLSIDNLFVFSLIFSYFQTPAHAQPKVLRYGLLAAVVLRAAFIFAGLAVVEREWRPQRLARLYSLECKRAPVSNANTPSSDDQPRNRRLKRKGALLQCARTPESLPVSLCHSPAFSDANTPS